MQEQQINIETVVHETKRRWLREEAPRKPARYYIAESVQYWIVIIALGVFALSATHTAQMFSTTTGRIGVVATVMVEFSLLYAAAQRRLAHSHQVQLERVVWLLEVLFFFIAVLVNGIGSLISVVDNKGLEALSTAQIIASFGSLPLGTQGALVLALVSSIAIPVAAIAAGEGVAKLMLENEAHADDFKERRWQEVQETIIYQAIFARYRAVGMDAKTASKTASNEVRAYLQSGRVSAGAMLSAPVRTDTQTDKRTNGQIRTTDSDGQRKRTKVREYLEANPELLEGYPVRDLVEILNGQGIECARQMVNEVRNEVRAYLQVDA